MLSSLRMTWPKVAQLPLSYRVSKDELGANVLQNPVVGPLSFQDTLRSLL